ncbi:hypothetical protein ACUY28_05625 [Corynebacterium sanguinis]|uniref:hypothetical protein n=1 Tax=Corynebacterium sanguinis TaxID=2594913 RepID=UPI00223AFCD5|nr:hypothetical protein [Corynebacterium sanguinis]MCT1492475.1 hypothetical protein [Corynebacterium sanguinis]MCT2023100.1 hypothetical protein [Corynebacterium sanguinis]MCT2247415.1 hypothetical protein [Corynebacterium sanguinis]MCT2251055.1 hypothetical protein [Corynebacterium sanguinis]MDN8621818.1 hypothetical protein [Corynebacterium sanguinis]
MNTLTTLSSLVDGSSALNLGSSLAGFAITPALALTEFMKPFVQVADGLATLLGLIA